MNLRLAWRNVWRNKVRSLIIISSVVLGLVAGIFLWGLYEGMVRARVRTVIDTEVTHLQIHHPKFRDDYEPGYIIKNSSIHSLLRQNKKVKCVATRTITQGMLATTTGSAGVQVNGINPNEENEASQLHTKLIDGKTLGAKQNGILIGKKLADKMKLSVGNKLVLMFTDKNSNITSGAFRVTGIYQTINTPLDERNVYVHQRTLNTYLDIGGAYHEIAILLYRDEDLDMVKYDMKKLFPDYRVQTWKEISPETQLMVTTTNQFSIIFIIIIMIALAFGIINTMLMSVLERTREIGMLTALGMNKVKVFTLILSETIILTMAGTPVGLLSGWLIIAYYSKTGIDVSSFSEDVMSGFGFSSMIYPEFPMQSIATIIIIVLSTALASALFPSIKAIKLQPADALRQ